MFGNVRGNVSLNMDRLTEEEYTKHLQISVFDYDAELILNLSRLTVNEKYIYWSQSHCQFTNWIRQKIYLPFDSITIGPEKYTLQV